MAKDKPRYRVVREYEDNFKKAYIIGLSKTMSDVIKKIVIFSK